MKARQTGQPVNLALVAQSRRTMLKGSLALGSAALIANRSLAGSALGQDQSISDATPAPIEAPVIAEWTINNPSGVFVGFDSIWVPGHHDLTTTRIDPSTNEIVAVINLTGYRASEALEVEDVLWVNGQANDTTWIDPNTNSVPESAPRVPGTHYGMSYGSDSLWIVNSTTKVDRVDPATGEINASISYGPGNEDIGSGISFKAGFVWISRWDGPELIKIDPATNAIVSRTPFATFIDQANAQTSVPAGKGTDSLWLRTGPDESPALLRVDPVTESGLSFVSFSSEQMSGAPSVVTDSSVWLKGLAGLISRVDIASGMIDLAYDTGQGDVYGMATHSGSLWIEKYDLNLVQRLDIAP